MDQKPLEKRQRISTLGQIGLEGRWGLVRIQADDAFDARVGGETGGHPGAERPADAGHNDDARG